MKHYSQKNNIFEAYDGYLFQLPNSNMKVKKLLLGREDNIDNYFIIKNATEWRINTEYSLNEVCEYNNKIYKCLLNHISSEILTPENTLNYWVEQ